MDSPNHMLYRLVVRFKLNSINYGDKVIGVVGLLTIVVPLALYGIHLALGFLGFPMGGIFALAKISLGIGGILLGVFAILMVIEFAQDRYLDAYYSKVSHHKVKLPDGCYECQSCGHQRVREADRGCPVCGETFT